MTKGSRFNFNRLWLLGACQLLLSSANDARAAVFDYEGVIGKEKIGLALEAPEIVGPIPPGPLKGHYFYVKYNKNISLDGDIDKFGNVTLYEREPKGKMTAMIKGKLEPSISKLTGTWSRLDGSELLPFSVTSRSAVGGTLENRYMTAGVEMPQAAFENKVRAFVDAVAAGNKNAVADMVAYPLRVNQSNKRLTIRNKRELLSRYVQVFNPAFRKLVGTCEVHDLFARDQGVMLGSGQVWFDADGKAYVLNP